MEEVRQLVQEEGREARNLVAFHVAVDTPVSAAGPPRKPPRAAPGLGVGVGVGVGVGAGAGAVLARRGAGRAARRSASAGRDKRSELRARYWALLFGDLQRAIGEIYNTVEAHENLNECQEVILVLENYTRDFKALGEWFRLKWEYDNTPPPQRPQSLAWEIRKTDFVRPESKRTYSVKSSPSVSGKNSPCLSGHNTPSGKNSPSLTGKASPGSGKISPRVSSGHSSTSPKANIEFFSSKIIASKITAKPEPKAAKETRLSDIKEKDCKDSMNQNGTTKFVTKDKNEDISQDPKLSPIIEIGKAKEYTNACPKQVIVKSPKHKANPAIISNVICQEPVNRAKKIEAKLDAMENDFLVKSINESQAKNDNLINKDKENEKVFEKTAQENLVSENVPVVEENVAHDKSNDKIVIVDAKENNSTESPTKSEDNFADISNESLAKSSDDKANNIVENGAKEKHPEESFEKHPIEISEDQSEVSQIVSEKVNINHLSDAIKEPEMDKVTSDNNDSKDIMKTESKKNDSKIILETKVSTKPAYSQAAAKPKPIIAKVEVKTPTRTPLMRSKTVVELRPNSAPKSSRQFPKRNQNNQASKCSYPFNLTTGRSSLFDGTPSSTVCKGVVSKKPAIKNAQIAPGDNKFNQNKTDLKKRPPRPTSLKITEKGDKKEKNNPPLEKIKDCDEYSSSDTIVTQIDMSRIESNESLKTLVPEELQMIQDVANSVEVLNVDANKNDNEGWLTVKSRRLSRESKKQSKSHWANRFHQPSATTSLPTLNMIESPKQEVKAIVDSPKNAKLDRAMSEQPQSLPKSEKLVKVSAKNKSESKSKDTAIIRQKSDVTGLKTRSSRNKAFSKRSEKHKDVAKDEVSSDLTKNRLHSSLESLTMGLARSQESTEDAFDFDKWKAEFKSTFKYLEEDDQIPNHNEILKSADPSEMSEIAEMTSQIEENEKKISWALDFQSEVDQRKLCEEEDLLNRQIMELQQVSDIDLDTETDDTETDAEILCEGPSISRPSCTSPENLGSLAASLEDQYETALAGMSWAERIDTLVVLEALVARDPGRAQQLHAKLSQGIKRRGSFQDALRRLQAKQARAERQRLEYQTERAKKIHQLLARVEEVKVAKNQLIEEKRLRMEHRLQKAAENRDQRLKDIVRKAHDEEEKLREIAFIKHLEAENRRHDFLDQCRSHTTRLRQMRRERLLKLEQKAAREAAVGARRQALEEARRLHVESLLEKRKERDARVEELKELKKQERDDAAREKAEGVKSRLSALAAAAELEADALRSRIRDKQDASQQRLESHLQAIREKATGPRQPTTSESQDQNTKEEKELAEEAERVELERKEREKQKAIKRKARKVRQKLLSTSNEISPIDDGTILFEPTFQPSDKLHKVINTLTKIITPLTIDKEIQNHNGIEHDIDKNNKKNKKANKNLTNGDLVEEKKLDKKTNKKKKNDNNLEFNNNTEFIDDQDVKKRKKKEKSERARLSKSNSVCSSLSDMSKASCKTERRIVVIDTTVLERQLNELYRLMEKFDRFSQEKVTFQKVQCLKVLGQLIAVAAERDDVASQLTPKSLTTAVTTISRAAAACRTSAAHVMASHTCVHLVKLLADQLEKDLQADQKEMELCKQLCDCLSVTLDSVLCSTRLYENTRSKYEETLPTLRNRAHTLISYLCLSGCISRAETAGEARESTQTLLTLCADLCHPCDVDIGSERASASQSLRCALGTGVCGARAEFCGLFARGAQLGRSGGFVRAARTTHLLRALAERDHHIVQNQEASSLLVELVQHAIPEVTVGRRCLPWDEEQVVYLFCSAQAMNLQHSPEKSRVQLSRTYQQSPSILAHTTEAFGEGGWPLEFRAAVARLLSQHAPNDKEAPRNTALRLGTQRLDQTLSETMVLDLIVLVGFVVVNNPQLQETISDGWSVIKTLCTLPANWLVSKTHSHALLPTLVALAQRPATAAVIATELSMEMLDEYMESPEAQKVKMVQVIKQGRTKKGSGKKQTNDITKNQ